MLPTDLDFNVVSASNKVEYIPGSSQNNIYMRLKFADSLTKFVSTDGELLDYENWGLIISANETFDPEYESEAFGQIYRIHKNLISATTKVPPVTFEQLVTAVLSRPSEIDVRLKVEGLDESDGNYVWESPDTNKLQIVGLEVDFGQSFTLPE